MARDNEPRIPGNRSMALDSTGGLGVGARIETTQLEGFDNGPRFGAWWLPGAGALRGAVLCVQPLGRERTAARHALAAQAWRLAARGWGVLLVDLYGTGDSPGEPGEATIEGWRRDLLRAAMLVRQRHAGPNVLWGVRGGALLAADIAVALDQLVDAYVFWHAPARGDRIAEGLASEGGSLSPAMIADLQALHMQPPPAADHGSPPGALFLEINEAAVGPAEVSAATCELTETWLEAGYLATPRPARARAFWAARAAGSRSPGAAAPLPVAAFMATEEFLEGVR